MRNWVEHVVHFLEDVLQIFIENLIEIELNHIFSTEIISVINW